MRVNSVCASILDHLRSLFLPVPSPSGRGFRRFSRAPNGSITQGRSASQMKRVEVFPREPSDFHCQRLHHHSLRTVLPK